MRLFGLRREISSDAVRLTASCAWEDSDRPGREIWAEVPPELGPALADELDGFAVAASVVAQHHGERRLLVEGTLCPRLSEGLATATALLSGWFGPPGRPPVIEASRGTAPRLPTPFPRAAVFLSGGIDSFFAVAQNRDRYPRDHPASFCDAIVVDGYCFEPASGSPRSRDYWRRTRRATSAFAAVEGLEPIYVRTNLRALDDDFAFFGMKYHAAMLGSVAHLLSKRVSAATIAAGLDVPMLRPWGSHPVLDPLYSGSRLAVFHEGIEVPRIEKVDRVAAWPEALASLIVCNEGPLESGSLNCGRCEKCVRTLAALASAGASADFESARLSADALRDLPLGPHPWAVAGFWSEIAERLRARGDALASAADGVLARARASDAWHADRGWKGAIRRLDRRWLGSALLRSSRRLRGRA